MRKFTKTLALAWLIMQMPLKELKALKSGELIELKAHSIEIWATSERDIFIIKPLNPESK